SAADVGFQRIRINVGLHSRLVEPILAEFHEFASRITFSPPQIPFVSNVTGTWIEASEATDPEYWTQHIRQPVAFEKGLSTILERENAVLLEVGPGRTLATLADMHSDTGQTPIITTMRHPKEDLDDESTLIEAVGKAWCEGVRVDWEELNECASPMRIPLPTYPFERQHHWIKPGLGARDESEEDDEVSEAGLRKLTNIDEWINRVVWKRTNLLTGRISGRRNWLILSPAQSQQSTSFWKSLEAKAERLFSSKHIVSFGSDLQLGTEESVIRPANREDYDKLFVHLRGLDFETTDVLHVTDPVYDETVLSHAIETNFFSLLFLSQAAIEADVETLRTYSVTFKSVSVLENEQVDNPHGSLVSGPCLVLAKEIPSFAFQQIDIDAISDESADRTTILLGHEPSSETLSIRNNGFFRRTVEPHPTPVVHEVSSFRKEQTYIITGGAGGVGMEIAQLLATKYNARVVLIGRTRLPASSEWAAAVEDRSKPEAVRNLLARLIGARERMDIEYVSADVTDEASVQEAIQSVVDSHGPVDGILHAAGVLNDGPALSKAAESAQRVLAPKTIGAEILVRAAKASKVRLVVLFSSTSAVLAPAGQIDYVSANAYLNSLASRSSSEQTTVTSVCWGMWRNLGMTASSETDDFLVGTSSTSDATTTEVVGNPLFDQRQEDETGATYFTLLDPSSDWFINEHRLWTGQALAPGTMILELVRAAYAAETKAAPCVISDLIFAEALSVPDGAKLVVGVELRAGEDNSVDVSVFSRRGGQRLDHAFANVAALVAEDAEQPFDPVNTDDVRRIGPDDRAKQERWLDFGPRWRCLRTVQFASGAGSAELELLPQYASEVNQFGLHPALLDIATGFALPLDEGYEAHDEFYVPLAYRAIRFYSPLPERFISDARLTVGADAHPDFVTLDYR
ncbi:MAG: SDR family NAD(P)-dependent oxidoreductase, partial [Rhodothermales bacterium]|nr:SDR family NAD(P)-dependent oxidoreductase [Rhodothermales bacterium]